MLKSFRQMRVMSKQEEELYRKYPDLFQEVLAEKSIPYYIRTCYVFWIKRFVSMMCEEATEFSKCFIHLFSIVLNTLLLPFYALVIPFGAIARRNFHKEIWEKIQTERRIKNDF